ncbi:MAG TPA: hypothetical protein PLK30_23335 [Blastocatellia bacterium]|nr:hypothetical protein [Blastocatellia bacterium]
MVNQTVEFVEDQNKLATIIERISSASALALDIETINWWDRDAERVALIQLAYREGDGSAMGNTALPIRVSIIDPLVGVDLSPLRLPLELGLMPKAIHNANYDAVRLARHYGISTSPIFDTMLAARRSGEKKCSLKAQVETHLGFRIDKAEQRGDWGRRPLTREQLEYAALDASCTLLLYERQFRLGLRGDYELNQRLESPTGHQNTLPLQDGGARTSSLSATDQSRVVQSLIAADELSDLSPAGLALLGIIAELSGRYSPEQLAVSVGGERIGLAGWIVDRILGKDEDVDELTAKHEITTLCERGLIEISLSRRLEVAPSGIRLWKLSKPKN